MLYLWKYNDTPYFFFYSFSDFLPYPPSPFCYNSYKNLYLRKCTGGNYYAYWNL